ncbi:MAG: serine--tRNA ligase [bacterium]
MIDLHVLRENPKEAERLLQTKRPECSVNKAVALDERYRKVHQEVEEARGEKNAKSRQIPQLHEKERMVLLRELKRLDEKLTKKEKECSVLAAALEHELLTLPNFPRPDVKAGASEKENEVLRTVGDPPHFPFSALQAHEIAEKLQVADLPRATKTSGSHFVYFQGALVHLELALLRYLFSRLLPKHFVPILPPVLINRKSMEGMGYLQHGGEVETYHLPKDDLYLVGTAEQSIGPMLQEEVLAAAELPKRYIAYSPSFRREAGGYGKDTKGFFRVHQFSKAEMFSFTTADASDAEHELFLSLEEELMRGLNIPYRVIKMCTADLGDPAARKYDIEAWFPGQQRYRETHSTSTCTDFQSRRLNIRYRTGKGTAYVHTVNGTAFAMGRILMAIMENYQTATGDVHVPDVLQPFCEFALFSEAQGGNVVHS